MTRYNSDYVSSGAVLAAIRRWSGAKGVGALVLPRHSAESATWGWDLIALSLNGDRAPARDSTSA